jgi:hypothetical protein
MVDKLMYKSCCDFESGIATAYGLDVQDSIPGRSFLFFTASRLALGPTQPPIQWVSEARSPGVK